MKKSLVSLSLALPLLAACSGGEVKSALGLKKHSPDEFMVLSRPALTVPPSFDLPEPAAPSVTPQSQAVEQAKSAVLGGNPAAAGATASAPVLGSSNAENTFLAKAGASNASSAIRLQLDQDAREASASYFTPPAEEEKGFFGRLFSPIKLDSSPDPVVNPEAEKERIKQQIEEGGPVSGEDVPTIQPKGESVIDKIF